MTSRRAFILGAAAVLAAPAIVKAESLMKIAVLRRDVIGYDWRYRAISFEGKRYALQDLVDSREQSMLLLMQRALDKNLFGNRTAIASGGLHHIWA